MNEVLYARPGETYSQYERRLGTTPGGTAGTGFLLPKKPGEAPVETKPEEKSSEDVTFIRGTKVPSTGDSYRDEEIAAHQERVITYDAEASSPCFKIFEQWTGRRCTNIRL